MYDELIKRLRLQADAEKFYSGEPMLYDQAADAIEELSVVVRAQKAVLDKFPRWIPVTERLPEDGVFVLVCNDDGHMMIAKYESEVLGWYYKYTNYDFDMWDNEEQGPVCYWMPLPEPPKEDGE